KILEEAIFIGHSPDLSNPMIIRLIEAYSQAGMRDRAEDTLALLADIPDAIAYDPRYVFDDYNNIIYKPEHYRPYLPKPKHIIKPVTQAWDPFASGSTASQAPPDAGPSYADDANF
ncbi:MAG: hypothetical protein JSS86_17380, partial [Cyanobacteria bacterium SZAS LIN-2]|nr:hypothetical protein [Cyanobacteria bacterium SZAS LIN-2]